MYRGEGISKGWTLNKSLTSLPFMLHQKKSYNFHIKPNSIEKRFYSLLNSYRILINARLYSSSKDNTLTHVSNDGKATMVDVGDKNLTDRRAVAKASVWVGPEVAKLIQDNSMKKGDVLGITRTAGIMGAKWTSKLIPLCHDVALSQVKVDAILIDETVEIIATARCTGQTGVEMEALTAVSIAALTVYDMSKAVNRSVLIKNIYLVQKTGGASGDFINEKFK